MVFNSVYTLEEVISQVNTEIPSKQYTAIFKSKDNK